MSFGMTLTRVELERYLVSLLSAHLPDGSPIPSLESTLGLALERTEYCFSRIHRKYFNEGDQRSPSVILDHLNGDHMSAFLYLMSNTVFVETGNVSLATKLFYLNKILHGLDAYFSVKLPDIFRFVHPVGTVLGRAEYGNYLMVYQNCGVGADEEGIYPKFGEGVILYARSSVLGNSRIGNNVVIGANAFVLNTDVPDGSVVVGQYPSLKLLPNARPVRARAFELP